MTGSENLNETVFFFFPSSSFFCLLVSPPPPFSHQNLSRAVTGTKLS